MAKREEVEEVQSRIEHLENKLDILLNVIYEDSIARSRARTKLKLETRETIESLKREKSTLNEKVQN